jgi:hypothetical protein
MMRTRLGRGQSGEGKLPLILGILVVAGAIYLLTLTIPPRIAKAEFADYIEARAHAYVANEIKMDGLQNGILEEAKKVGIPLHDDHLDIVEGDTKIIIRAKYDVEKKLIGGKIWVQHYEIEKEIPKI